MNLKSVLATCCVLVVRFKFISAEPFVCPADGSFSDPESVDCKNYFKCQSINGILEAKEARCPGATVFDPSLVKCVGAASYTCPGPVTTTTEVPTVETTSTESPSGFICPGEGRFANQESVDCKSYYNCVLDSDGNVIATLYFCPSSTVYDGLLNKCVAASTYTCTIEVTTSTETTPEPTTTTVVLSTEQPTTSQPYTSTAEPGVFTCVTSGRFPNPEQSDCQTYKYCLQTAATTFQEYTFHCPAGSNFSPTESRCTVGYICPKAVTTTTTEVPTTTAADAAFVCNVEGRFPDPESCNQYIFCTRAADGSLVQHAFRCPPNSWFKPNESRCSASYVCV